MLTSKPKKINDIITPIFTIVAIYCVVFTIVSYCTNRSLRLDEAMFAQTILTRDFGGILAGNFDYGQSGSLGYILIVKMLTLAFGGNEYVLRFISLLSYFLSIILGMKLLRDVFDVKYSSVAFLFMAGCAPFVKYAVDFKPYSLDVALSFFSILLYYRFFSKKMSFLTLIVIYSVLIWFSFGNIFVIAGISIYHVINKTYTALKNKDNPYGLFLSFWPFLLLLVSVGLDYFFWVKPTSDAVTSEALEYWRFLSFPLIPKSLSDLGLMSKMFNNFCIETLPSHSITFFLLLFLLGMVLNRKKAISSIFLITLLVVICVSYTGMYPIDLRLQLFLFGIYIVIIVSAFEYIIRKIVVNRYGLIFISILFIQPSLAVTRHNIFNDFEYYMSDEECRMVIEYYNQIKRDSDVLYVHSIAKAQCSYYQNYPIVFKNFNDDLIEKDHVIWGSKYRIMKNERPYEYNYVRDNDKFLENIKTILRYNKVYLIRVHSEGVVFDWLLEELEKYGDVTIEYDFCSSILYKFEKRY